MLRKSICAFILFVVIAIIPGIVLADNTEASGEIVENFSLNESEPQFFGDQWFEKTVNQIENDILAAGYTASTINSLGKAIGAVSYENAMYQPKKITVLFDTATQMPTSISYSYAANAEIYDQLYSGLNGCLGEAVYQAAYTEIQSTYSIEYGEALLWHGTNYQFKMNGEGGDTTFGIYQIQTGQSPFVFTVSYDENAVTDKAKGLISAASALASPTATPKPMPVNLDVEIASVRIGKDSIGNPEVFVVFKNTSSTETIDRIDFSIRCFDAYGAEIKPYGFYDWTDNFYDDKELKPGRTTSSDWRWTIYGVDGTKSVKIAITKYHTISGKTVEVPTGSWVWETYN